MRLGFLLAILFPVLAQFQAMAAERRVLTLAYDVNESWPWHLGTYTVPDAMPGLSLEYISEAARRLDVDIRFVRAPFRRALAMLKGEEVDGVFEASFRPERQEYGVYPLTAQGEPDASRSMFVQSYVFYVRRGERRFR